MISEKTVELNVTAELLNFLFTVTKRTHTAIAPSQRAEGKLGYDVAYRGSARVALIQYKRAYPNGSVWSWRLNRTRLKDQHQRLQRLESLGLLVFYAFPYFCMPAEVASKRMQLLKWTFWYRPSAIKPPGGPTGYHNVFFDSNCARWWVSSPEEFNLPAPLSISAVVNSLGAESAVVQYERLDAMLNKALLDPDEPPEDEAISTEEWGSSLSAQSLILCDESVDSDA